MNPFTKTPLWSAWTNKLLISRIPEFVNQNTEEANIKKGSGNMKNKCKLAAWGSVDTVELGGCCCGDIAISETRS